MSPIMELIKHSENIAKHDDLTSYEVRLRDALPDLQRLTEWVKSADHKNSCMMNSFYEGEGKCTCGLNEILKLLED